MSASAEGRRRADEASHWRAIETDGPVVLLRSRTGEEALVEHDGTRWTCSRCGEHTPNLGMKCAHVDAASRNLPVSVALAIAASIARPLPDPPASSSKRTQVEREAERARTEAAMRGARLRAAQEAEWAEQRRAITSGVVVRPMTDEDRARLADRRAARRRRRGRPEPDDLPLRWA